MCSILCEYILYYANYLLKYNEDDKNTSINSTSNDSLNSWSEDEDYFIMWKLGAYDYLEGSGANRMIFEPTPKLYEIEGHHGPPYTCKCIVTSLEQIEKPSDFSDFVGDYRYRNLKYYGHIKKDCGDDEQYFTYYRGTREDGSRILIVVVPGDILIEKMRFSGMIKYAADFYTINPTGGYTHNYSGYFSTEDY